MESKEMVVGLFKVEYAVKHQRIFDIPLRRCLFLNAMNSSLCSWVIMYMQFTQPASLQSRQRSTGYRTNVIGQTQISMALLLALSTPHFATASSSCQSFATHTASVSLTYLCL